jgi:hypothetical protein
MAAACTPDGVDQRSGVTRGSVQVRGGCQRSRAHLRDVSQSGDELAEFKEFQVPRLRDWGSQRPDYPTWRQQELDGFVTAAAEELPTRELVVRNLSPIDAIFGLLGIVTAWKRGSWRGSG